MDGSGTVTITDAVIIVNYLFLGGTRPRLRLADVNSSRSIEITDPIRILQHLFCGVPFGS